MSRRSMDESRSPRSSHSGRCRPAPRFATSGECWRCPTARSIASARWYPTIPANPTPLKKAIEEEPKLREEAEKEPVVSRLLDIAQRIEGLYRHASTHAAGIVIGDRPLSQLVPMYRDPRSDMPVTQFNMKWVEKAGLVKFDFLGLKTLTVLKTAVDFLSKRDIKLDLEALPLDDQPTYDMLSRGETVGVFQVESAGMRKALNRHAPGPDRGHHCAGGALPPGAPMENIPVYNARKHGEEEVALDPSQDRLSARRNTRGDRLPGTGHADRPGSVGILAG